MDDFRTPVQRWFGRAVHAAVPFVIAAFLLSFVAGFAACRLFIIVHVLGE